MPVIVEQQVTDGNGRNPQAEKSRYALDMRGFWLRDKFPVITNGGYASLWIPAISGSWSGPY